MFYINTTLAFKRKTYAVMSVTPSYTLDSGPCSLKYAVNTSTCSQAEYLPEFYLPQGQQHLNGRNKWRKSSLLNQMCLRCVIWNQTHRGRNKFHSYISVFGNKAVQTRTLTDRMCV